MTRFFLRSSRVVKHRCRPNRFTIVPGVTHKEVIVPPTTKHFEQVAEAVTERAAELLSACISVVDAQGFVVKSSDPKLIGLTFDRLEDDTSVLRVPLQFDGQRGEVVVRDVQVGEAIPQRLTRELIELMINQTKIAMRLPNQHELKDRFIYNLLHGLTNNEEAILREARMLGMDFDPPRAVILIDATDYIHAPGLDQHEAADAQIRRRVQLIIGTIVGFFQLPNDTICAYLGNGEVAVLKASNTKNLATWVEAGEGSEQANASWANLGALRRAGESLLRRLRSDTGAAISMGIGRYHPGVCGLAHSYEDARAALSLGRRFHGLNGVHCLDRLGVAAFIGVADEQTKIDLATHLLSPLDHEPELLATLNTFFVHNCSPGPAAQALSIHRNTLGYRLQKIASLTGLDPRGFDPAVQIRLALLLRSFKAP
ncbi:MAG: helix-turn-helix domain-containing protein [Herpetosiphonaceae bacterium]|nr:helix-turn-helix domain-containing protein [Herpetosiphonaceae bacterium]